MNVMIKSLFGCALAWGIQAHATTPFSNFTVSPGNWVVTSEVNGLPGRGMGIEVRDNTLVMAVYNYTASGEATFHLTAGPMTANYFTGQLQAYKGGRYLGSSARDAAPDGSAGEVKLHFTSSTTGTITFPGEQPLEISRFMFNDAPPEQFMRAGATSVWLMTELDSDNQPLSSSSLIFAKAKASGQLTSYVLGADGNVSASFPCQVGAASGTASCSIAWLSGKPVMASVELQRFGRQLEGSISKTTTPNVRNRLVGTRLLDIQDDGPKYIHYDSTAGASFMKGLQSPYVPEAGMWIIDSENTGNPGRGMSIDLQANTLVMQLYGYKADGKSTFHIGSGTYAASESVVRLLKVRGGRYFGSGALSGADDGNDGDALVRFSSPTTGQIRLPGEQWVSMQKFTVGSVAPALESLLGSWVFWTQDTDAKIQTTLELTDVKNGYAVSPEGIRCRYETTAQGAVRCTEVFTISGRGSVYSLDYRFTPAYGLNAAAGVAKEIPKTTGQPLENGKDVPLIVQRIVDRHQVVAGALDTP